MDLFLHLDMTAEDPVVTVDRGPTRTRLTITANRPGASSVTIDMPVDVVIPNARRVETATATGT